MRHLLPSVYVQPMGTRTKYGSDGQSKIVSVTILLTNFLKLPLISKKTVGAGAQGEPPAIFQLVSPERQIRILCSTLREERMKTRRREEVTALLRSTLQGQREGGRMGRQAKRTVKDVQAAISFLWGDQIKWLWQQFSQNICSSDRQTNSPKPVSEKSHSSWQPLEGMAERDEAPAQQYQLTAACFSCRGTQQCSAESSAF